MLALTLTLALGAAGAELPDTVEVAEASTCPEGAWPDATWTDASDQAASERPEAVAALDAYLFPDDLDRDDRDRRGIRTDGVVIVHRGRVIYERYGGGYTADTRHLAWSATKTFTNALAGVAVAEGRLSLEDSVCDHVEGLPDASCAVRLQDLLEFASGFDWRETYEGVSPRASSVLAMLYGEGRGDMARFVGHHPLRDAPGTTWMYSSGDTNLLSAAVGAVLAPAHGERFPWTVLLDPIGASGAIWERDGAGTYVGSSWLWATPRDLARFGLLLARDGCWDGERLLPEGWVEASTQVSAPIRREAPRRDPGDVQGRQIWLNRPVGEEPLPWPSAPEGAFAARGHWGQSITVLPSHDLVVVRTADDRDGRFELDALLARALALIGEAEAPSPPPPQEDEDVAEASGEVVKYDNTLFQLGAGFAAKEACSCVFVSERSEEACAEWVRVSPDIARFRVDREAREVRARALGMAKTVARFEDGFGCRVVER